MRRSFPFQLMIYTRWPHVIAIGLWKLRAPIFSLFSLKILSYRVSIVVILIEGRLVRYWIRWQDAGSLFWLPTGRLEEDSTDGFLEQISDPDGSLGGKGNEVSAFQKTKYLHHTHRDRVQTRIIIKLTSQFLRRKYAMEQYGVGGTCLLINQWIEAWLFLPPSGLRYGDMLSLLFCHQFSYTKIVIWVYVSTFKINTSLLAVIPGIFCTSLP